MTAARALQLRHSHFAERDVFEMTPRRQARRTATAVHSPVNRFLNPLQKQLRMFLAPHDLYRPVKATILADGPAIAAALVIAAVLVNHIRRVLVPWLGQFLWWHPVQVMKLARGMPHYFIEEQLLSATDVEALVLWAFQTAVLSATRALLRHRLVADATVSTDLKSRQGQGKGKDGGGGSGRGTESRAAAMRRATVSHVSCFTDCHRIVYLALCLMQLEYAYAEACWAVSWTYASMQVYLRGSSAERQFAHRLLMGEYHLARPGYYQESTSEHWRALLLISGLLLWWLWRIQQPFRHHGVVGVALSGLPIFAGLIGIGTAHIVKYSNKYFIWLEMSEMLLTWVWLVLGVSLVAAWRLCDVQSPK